MKKDWLVVWCDFAISHPTSTLMKSNFSGIPLFLFCKKIPNSFFRFQSSCCCCCCGSVSMWNVLELLSPRIPSFALFPSLSDLSYTFTSISKFLAHSRTHSFSALTSSHFLTQSQAHFVWLLHVCVCVCTCVCVWACVSVCVCVCVLARDRERYTHCAISVLSLSWTLSSSFFKRKNFTSCLTEKRKLGDATKMKKSLKGRQSCCFVAVVVVVVVMRKTKLFSFNLAQKKTWGRRSAMFEQTCCFRCRLLIEDVKKIWSLQILELGKKS